MLPVVLCRNGNHKDQKVALAPPLYVFRRGNAAGGDDKKDNCMESPSQELWPEVQNEGPCTTKRIRVYRSCPEGVGLSGVAILEFEMIHITQVTRVFLVDGTELHPEDIPTLTAKTTLVLSDGKDFVGIRTLYTVVSLGRS